MFEFEVVITNGYVSSDTIYTMTSKGWTFIITIPAKLIHPHALDTDKATIFSKYHEPKIDNSAKYCASEPVEEMEGRRWTT